MTVGDDVGIGVDVSGDGVSVDGGCDDMFEPVTDTSPSPPNSGMSAIAGGSLGSWHCRLRIMGGDGLVVAFVSSPTGPAASFLDAACVWRATAAAFVVAAAALGAAAAVAFEAATAA